MRTVPFPLNALTAKQRFLLAWLAKEAASAYGECYGPDLDFLIGAGLAKVRANPTDWSAVTLTENGVATAARLEPTP